MDESILKKIERCLALSKSCNANEAAIALRQAQKLMQEQGLQSCDVLVKAAKTKTIKRDKSPQYEARLFNVVGDAFKCKPIVGYQQVTYVGIGENPAIAAYAFEVLNRQLIQARKDYISTQLNRVRIKTNKTKRADLFCQGWVHSACKQLHKLVATEQETQLIQQYLAANFKTQEVDSKPSPKINQKSFNDLHNGVQKGKRAQLNHGVNGSKALAIGLEA